MELACSAACLPGLAPEETAGIIRRAGFDRVEAAVGSTLPGLPATVLRASLESLPPRRHRHVPENLPAAGYLLLDTTLNRRDSLEVLLESLQALLDHLAVYAAGLRPAILNRCGSRIEQPEDLLLLFQKLDDAPLQVAVDTLEFHRASVNPCDVLRCWTDRLSVVRLADTAGGRPVPLGEGEVNIPAVLERLKNSGFAGTLVVAGTVPPGADPLAWLSRQREVVCRHLR